MGESQRQTKEKFRYFFPSFVENVDRLERSACMIKITVDANSSSIEIFVRTRLVPTSGRYNNNRQQSIRQILLNRLDSNLNFSNPLRAAATLLLLPLLLLE
jgi:hypothetical protein|mmetsp:Transcript_1505/g.4578  ORF Transcript_1505/g.4578 Transcript_1505/m.4578 type:complete len:101 (+) Transcript_1505:770-1072(+)